MSEGWKVFGGVVLFVSFFVGFMVFMVHFSDRQREQEEQKISDRVRKETTCELSDGRMINDICYKSDKLEVIEVG